MPASQKNDVRLHSHRYPREAQPCQHASCQLRAQATAKPRLLAKTAGRRKTEARCPLEQRPVFQEEDATTPLDRRYSPRPREVRRWGPKAQSPSRLTFELPENTALRRPCQATTIAAAAPANELVLMPKERFPFFARKRTMKEQRRAFATGYKLQARRKRVKSLSGVRGVGVPRQFRGHIK